MTTSNICKCGHEIYMHDRKDTASFKTGCAEIVNQKLELCTCKIFEPVNQSQPKLKVRSPSGDNSADGSSDSNKSFSTRKGLTQTDNIQEKTSPFDVSDLEEEVNYKDYKDAHDWHFARGVLKERQRLKKIVADILDETFDSMLKNVNLHVEPFGKGKNRDIDPREKGVILMLPEVMRKELKKRLGISR